MIVELRNLIGCAVGNVRAGGDAGVGAEDYAGGEGDGHDGRTGGKFAGFEVAGFGGFAGVGVVEGVVGGEGGSVVTHGCLVVCIVVWKRGDEAAVIHGSFGKWAEEKTS